MAIRYVACATSFLCEDTIWKTKDLKRMIRALSVRIAAERLSLSAIPQEITVPSASARFTLILTPVTEPTSVRVSCVPYRLFPTPKRDLSLSTAATSAVRRYATRPPSRAISPTITTCLLSSPRV